jgi:tRNA/rRNA methyltransferase
MVDVIFVLVEPAVPENIGAASRALKTMGFTKLRLVNPENHKADKAKWLAHGSTDILESALVFQNLEEAILGVDFVIGTTAKNRSTKADYYSPEELKSLVFQKADIISTIAIVFGREESGLTNEELRMCDVASSIPLHAPYPSINLAQSVMIYAYIFSSFTLKNSIKSPNTEEISDRLYSELKQSASYILTKLEIDKNINLYYRMLERLAATSADDARLLISFAKKIMQKFDKK